MAEHAQTNYVKIWAILCGLLVVSIVGPMFGIRLVTLITAFGIAIVKASLVANHFMHLGIEKRWVTYILLAMIAFMVVMFGGFAPDVMRHSGQRWQKTYVEPAAGGAAAAEGHR
jgi:caa(3)-type oxidase subunit IV